MASGRVQARLIVLGGLLAAAVPAGPAWALESPKMFMGEVRPGNHDPLPTSRIAAFADKRFNIIAGSRHVDEISSIRLGGRMTPKEFRQAQTEKHKDPIVLSRAEFKAYATRLAAAAHDQVKAGAAAHGAISLNELRTPAGKKLIRLLE